VELTATCCAIRGHPQLGFGCFLSTTAASTAWLGGDGPAPAGPSLTGLR